MKRILVLVLLLCLNLVFFSSNSILCRGALVFAGMPPLWYTAVRGLSAAAMLALLCLCGIVRPATGGRAGIWRDVWQSSSWSGALFLLGYMASFSFGYGGGGGTGGMSSAAGTLILNMCVQVGMLGWGFARGVRLNFVQSAGFIAAAAGLACLVSPGLSAPPLLQSALMGLAGFSWAGYCLAGRHAAHPALAAAGSFLRMAPLCLCLLAMAPALEAAPSRDGLACALLAGGVCSSLGYILWYWLQPQCSLVVSAVVQLAIPPVTACMGVIFLAEDVTLRLVASSVLILGGICLAVWPAPAARPSRLACAGKTAPSGPSGPSGKAGRKLKPASPAPSAVLESGAVQSAPAEQAEDAGSALEGALHDAPKGASGKACDGAPEEADRVRRLR